MPSSNSNSNANSNPSKVHVSVLRLYEHQQALAVLPLGTLTPKL